MARCIVHMEGAIVSINVKTARDAIDAEIQAQEIIDNIDGNVNIDGCEIVVDVFDDCHYCLKEFSEDQLNSLPNDNLACDTCYPDIFDTFRTITFQGRIGMRSREMLIAKYPGKGVSDLQVGDVLRVRPINDEMAWEQTRIYEMGDGLFLLERW